MIIYIPTKGRKDKQITYGFLPKELRSKVWFIVCSEEADHFRRMHGSQVLICDTPGVSPARQAAIDHGLDQYVFFLDDDLKFARRVETWTPEEPRLRQATPKDILDAFEWMEAKLQDYAQVGFSARGNNQSLTERYERIATRMMRAFGVDASVLQEEGIRFDTYKYWEDFHVTLCLLKKGYPNIASTEHCTDGITNADGGVSLYRNLDELLEVRARFLAEHAPFAKPNDKSAKSWKGELGGEGKTVPDLIIAWRKAYEYGKGQI